MRITEGVVATRDAMTGEGFPCILRYPGNTGQMFSRTVDGPTHCPAPYKHFGVRLDPSPHAACTWANPGVDPYQGAPAAAVDAYQDIPAGTRALLRDKIERRQYDDIAVITRDGISGHSDYADLRDMHFGKSTLCHTPDRSAWADSHRERGLVYCVDEHCLIVPTVCRNVSRVTRRPTRQLAGGGPAAPVSSAGGSGGPFGAIPLLQPIGGDASAAPGVVASNALGLLNAPVLTAAQVMSIPYQGAGLGVLNVATAPPAQYLSAPAAVPEPPVVALLLAGIAAIGWRARRAGTRPVQIRD